MPIIIEVTVRKTQDKLLVDPRSLNLRVGDEILVNTEDGLEHGRVLMEEHFRDTKGKDIKIYDAVRKLTEDDRRILFENELRSKDAFRAIVRKVDEKKVNMNLSCCEFIFDCGKVYVYYTAEGRVDFRELIKDLGHQFKTRIQMVQIGVRDEAKITGDCGPCGSELCCKKFLSDFKPVTIDMVKEQNLLMNPSKLSGMCGRLMCCMSFEFETYKELSRKFPRPGEMLKLENESWMVRDINYISGDIVLKSQDSRTKKINFKDLPGKEAPGAKKE